MLTRIILFLSFLVLSLMVPDAGQAQQAQPKRNFIRDAEVENTIRTFTTPLFQAAGLDPESIRLHFLVDNSLNAFVAGGLNMFIHTGLLVRAENPNQLIGVLAHETGHIAGGHLARMQNAAGNASTEALVGMLLGAAVGAATGRADAGAAIMLGAQSMAMRDILAYSRSEESSADQAAINYLTTTGQSPEGLAQFFEILGDQELLVTTRQDPYVRTHPLTRDRVAFVRDQVAKSKFAHAATRPEWIELQRRMRGKLFAFIEAPYRTLQRYKDSDTSLEARYARAIAYYRKPDMPKALAAIDELLAERPDDPYFWELKGQMLFENARGAEAIPAYRKAVDLLPDNALLHIELAQVEIEQEDPAMLADAQKHLRFGVQREPDNRTGWRLLAIAYGRDGEEGMAAYAMAEQALIEGKLVDANYHAGKAERLLPKTGQVWLRLQDIKERAAQVKIERQNDRR